MLVGLGIDELSMPPTFIPSIKRIVRSIRLEDAKRDVEKMLKLESADQIKRIITDEMNKLNA